MDGPGDWPFARSAGSNLRVQNRTRQLSLALLKNLIPLECPSGNRIVQNTVALTMGNPVPTQTTTLFTSSTMPKAILNTPIFATVLKVDKQGNEYVVTVQVGDDDFSGPLEKLSFENKPDQG